MSSRVLPVKVGDRITLKINSLNHNGEGVGRCQGLAVFVPFTVPGEEAEVKVTQTKKNFARAELLGLVQKSEYRSQPPCSTYGKCGGCQLQHINYHEQLELKRQVVEAALKRIGKLENVQVLPVLGMERPWDYRNKVHFKVQQQDGRFVLGYFGNVEEDTGSHKSMLLLERCSLIDEELNRTAKEVEDLLNKHAPLGSEQDFFQHVVLRKSYHTGEIMAVVVTSSAKWREEGQLAVELQKNCAEVSSVMRSVKQFRSRGILGEKSYVLAGKKYLLDQIALDGIGTIQFNISAESFFQVNPVQTVRLYAQVMQYARLTGKEAVIDAFCGTGTIALFLAKQADRVLGIEVVPEAIRDAEANAEQNGIDNAEFIVGKTEELLPKLFEQGMRPDLIVLDPPRKGCERAALEAIGAMQPERLIYVSCDPASLARDLGILEGLGYRTVEVQPVDMFPQTGHVECVVLLIREEK